MKTLYVKFFPIKFINNFYTNSNYWQQNAMLDLKERSFHLVTVTINTINGVFYQPWLFDCQ